MIVAYDPVAGEVTSENAVGLNRNAKSGLLVKHYREDGILYCELRGQDALLTFYAPDNRFISLVLVAAGEGRWRVVPSPDSL